MHREREGTAEAAVRSDRVQMSAEVMHRATDPLHAFFPSYPSVPMAGICMEGTARNHPALSLSKGSGAVG